MSKEYVARKELTASFKEIYFLVSTEFQLRITYETVN